MTYPSAPLGKIATIERKIIEPEDIPGGARYVGLENINSMGVIEDVRIRNGDLASTKFSFTSNDVLFGKLRPYLRKIARPSFDGICSTDIIPIRPSARVDRDYLFYFLRQDEIVKKAASLATGVNLPRISPRLLQTFEVPLPPLDEQRRVAALLDQADDLRRKRREAIGLVESLKRSMLDALLSEPGPNARELRLGDLVGEFRYGTSERSSEDGLPVLRIPNVIGNSITIDDLKYVKLNDAEIERLTLKQGDLLFVRTNGNREYVGRSAVVTPALGGTAGLRPHDFVYASYLIRARLKPNSADPVFLQAYLSSQNGRKAILERAKTSAGQFNINIEGLLISL